MKRTILVIVLSLALLLSVAPAALAENISPQAGVDNVDPTVSDVALRNAGDTAPVTSLDAEVEYLVKFTAADDNTLADLNTCVVNLYYESQAANAIRSYYTFTWTQSSNTWACANGAAYLDPTGSSTVPGDMSAGSFAFKLYFKLDGVAMPSGATKTWHVKVTVTDDTGTTPAVDSTLTFDVNEWRNIDSYTSSLNWGNVAPGASLASKAVDPTITANLKTDIQLTGADLTSGSNSIPMGQFEFDDATPLVTGTAFDGTAQVAVANVVETADSLDVAITGYTDAVLKALSIAGAVPTYQEDGTYTGTWTLSLSDVETPS